MIWLLLLLMCGSGAGIPAAFAQSSRAKKTTALPALPRQFPIESLRVEGNRNYTAAQILAVAALKVGQLAGKSDFEAAHDRLVATGMFETVGYKFAPGGDQRGYAASFQVVEAQPAYPIRFDDLGATDKDLTDYLRGKDPLFAPRLAATKVVLERYKQWVQEYVTAHNNKDTVIAKVVPAGAPAAPGEFVILFRPARSDPAVAEVAFEGNHVISTSALQNAIAEVAVGLPYKEEAFRQCLDSSIRPLYDARGRVRVVFTKLTVAKATDVQGLAVRVTLEEGGTYDLGGVRIEGAPHFEPARLLKSGKFKTGDLADFDEIGKGVDRIKKVLAHEGYMRNDVQIVRKIDDAKKTVSLAMHIEEGPQFLFGKLRIEGLDLNGEAAIRKMWTHQEGTPYNPDYPDYFLKHVREEGLFDNLGETRAETKIDDKTHIVNVTLNFKYAPPVNRKKTSPF
ncbi:MAG TPA: POTRA domain-containing protein [Bryobacteraceae bacterium]|jgi:outer membrane protein insertion porin family|nr:POTRA domain-containing protein [Bryobacteraceae bacterium]